MSAYVADYAPRGQQRSDDVALLVGGQRVTGWQRVSVTRGLDAVPAAFDIELTERYPNAPSVWVQPGQPCQVTIGSDLVITGYVDRYNVHLDPGSHTVRVQGRSKSEDLVDCSAFMGSADKPTFQVMQASALTIAQALAQPYGVTISSIAGEGAKIPQFNINLGETAWEIIDRVIRFSQLLAYDLPDGSVEMAQAGSERMGSGLTIGANVEAADATYTMDERFSEYIGQYLSVIVLATDQGASPLPPGKTITDTGVPRFRRRYVVSEQTAMGYPLADARAQWECNRRYGRSKQIAIKADAWRDGTGMLWEPNHIVPLALNPLKLDASEDFVIGTVTYTRGEDGQHASLLLMPRQAFDPEPVNPLPLPPLVGDIEKYNAAGKDPPIDPPTQTVAT